MTGKGHPLGDARSAGVAACALAAALLATAASVRADTLIARGAVWKYFRGTEAPSDPIEDWTLLEFDDADWAEGPTGIGYGDGDDATTLNDMRGNYLVVFCRKSFEIEDPARVKTLTLTVTYDDGYVAFINGIEVARSASMGNPGTPVTKDTTATGHEASSGADRKNLAAAIPELRAGTNVLAISVHNTNLTSSDLSFIPILAATFLPPPPKFKRSDADGDCIITVGDAVYLLNNLFAQGDAPPCLDAADANDDGELDVADAVYLLESIFAGGPPAPDPGALDCGWDPSDDGLQDCVRGCCG